VPVPNQGPGFPTSYVVVPFLCSVSYGGRQLLVLLILVELLTIIVYTFFSWTPLQYLSPCSYDENVRKIAENDDKHQVTNSHLSQILPVTWHTCDLVLLLLCSVIMYLLCFIWFQFKVYLEFHRKKYFVSKLFRYVGTFSSTYGLGTSSSVI
jgi:hypothetical protein